MSEGPSRAGKSAGMEVGLGCEHNDGDESKCPSSSWSVSGGVRTYPA